MNIENCIYFDLKDHILSYDAEKSILLCKDKKTLNKKWIKKVDESIYIVSIIEDKNIFYVSCESDEITGFLMALDKSDGKNLWEIQGKSCFQVIFNNYLYSVFIDDKQKYFFLKINPQNGTSVWFRETSSDLCEYSFTKKRILLTYLSGKTERLSPDTGENL